MTAASLEFKKMPVLDSMNVVCSLLDIVLERFTELLCMYKNEVAI